MRTEVACSLAINSASVIASVRVRRYPVSYAEISLKCPWITLLGFLSMRTRVSAAFQR